MYGVEIVKLSHHPQSTVCIVLKDFESYGIVEHPKSSEHSCKLSKRCQKICCASGKDGAPSCELVVAFVIFENVVLCSSSSNNPQTKCR